VTNHHSGLFFWVSVCPLNK